MISRRAHLLVPAVTVVTLLVAAALKARCLGDWAPGHQPKTCYNDIQTLWYSRSLGQHLAPWATSSIPAPVAPGDLVPAGLTPGQVEYPVLTAIFIWLTSLTATSAAGFLVASAIVLAPLAMITALALQRLGGRRALIFAASPALATYAFLNWDLLPVAATVLALLAWRRDRVLLATILLTLGGWSKLWPAILLIPLVAQILVERGRRDALRAGAVVVLLSLALNLPLYLADPRAWSAPFRAQSVRLNDFTTNSLWHWLARDAPVATVNLLAAGAVLTAWGVVAVVGVRRWRRDGVVDWQPLGAAMVTSYVLLGRVDSPQYTLWVLPFLVVLPVHRALIGWFLATDLALWLAYSWLSHVRFLLLPVAQGTRMTALLLLTLAFLRLAAAASPSGPVLVARGRAPSPAAASTGPVPARAAGPA